MFFCCGQGQGQERSKYALEVFRTPQQLSTVSEEKQVKLKAYIHANRSIKNSAYINNIGNKKGGTDLDGILNYFNANKSELQEFVMKKVMKSNYEALVQEHQKTAKQWTDPDFPPQQKSFGLARNTEKVNWKRIGDLVKRPQFMGTAVSANDILQGRIGDCYFLSAIAGLAEKEYRIKAIFPNLQINKNGIYMARVLHKGVLQQVVVDDYFPVSKKDNHIMCANPTKDGSIWVMILEKCWAKLYGSYDAIDGGLPNQVLHAFSGAPIYQYITTESTPEDIDEIFEKMLESTKAGHVVCCGTNEQPQIQEMGLVLGHAYTIIDVFDKPRRMVKVRNPWGERQWMGKASDNDKQFWNKMSNIDKKRLGYVQQNDGTFFILWQDFLIYFVIINICKANDRANYYYEELIYPKDVAVYTKLTCKGGNLTIALTQENTRGINVPAPRYATSTLLIARKVNNNGVEDYEYVASFTQRNLCDANQEVQDLPAGEYVIYSKLDGRNHKEEATLSCYCDKAVQLLPLAEINSEEFLHRVFLDHARKNKQNQQRIFGGMDVWVCMNIIYDSGYGYTVVHIGRNVKVKLGLIFHQQQYEQNNFQLLPPYNGAGIFKIVCESGQDSIVLCKIVPKSYSIQASMPIPTIKRLN